MFYWFSRITQKTNSPRLANIDIDVSPASNSVSSTQHPPFFRPIPSFPNSSILKSSTGNPQKSRVRYLSYNYFMIWNLKRYCVHNHWNYFDKWILIYRFPKACNLQESDFMYKFLVKKEESVPNLMGMIRPSGFQTLLIYR